MKLLLIMALPLIPIIGAAGSILNTGLNAAFTSATNRKQQQWNEKMYQLQRADALADWNRQNEYNSPTAQMARLRDAGLNPNLVYGNGATTTASPVRSVNMESWRPQTPQIDLGPLSQSLMSIYDIRLKEAQTDNLKAQNTVTLQDALLKAAQTASVNASTAKTNVDTEAGKFGLSQAQRLADTSAQMAEQQLRKATVETDIALQANERAAAQSAVSIDKSVEEILSLRAQRANTVADRDRIRATVDTLRKDSTLKQLDIELKKNGIQPGDPAYMRILSQMFPEDLDVKKIGSKVKSAARTVIDALKRYGKEGTIRFQY